MKKSITILLSIIALYGCSANNNQENITIQEIPNATPDEISSHKVKEEKILESKKELISEISTQQPIEQSKKFKIDDDDIPIVSTDKPIMVAVMAPMSGKYDMIGNAIMDGAHLGLMHLFEKYKIPVRLTAIDTGSGIEDMEFNISKLDETQFDIVLGITSDEQEQFIKLYLNNLEHKPHILSFNFNSENSCIVSPQNQLQIIKEYIAEKVYILVPQNSLDSWKNVNATVFEYNGNDLQNINQEFIKILDRISKENKDEKVYILFTENNWKLQKLMSQIDSMQLKNNIHVIISSFSNLNSRMESLNEKRHKFGNISVLMPNQSEYNYFIKEFYSLHKRRPLEVSFLAYNTIQQLKNGNIENSCKPELQLLNGNAKNNS